MKKQIIRLTEDDLHKIIKESVKQYLKENSHNMNEGIGNWMKGAALGGAMTLSPMANAQTHSLEPFNRQYMQAVIDNTDKYASKIDTIGNGLKEFSFEEMNNYLPAFKDEEEYAEVLKSAYSNNLIRKYGGIEKCAIIQVNDYFVYYPLALDPTKFQEIYNQRENGIF